MKRIGVAIIAVILLVAPARATAHDGHDHEQEDHASPHEHVHKHDKQGHSGAHDHHDSAHAKTAAELVSELDNLVAKVSEAVATKELSELQGLTEEIMHVASHIPEEADTSKQARIKGTTANIIILAKGIQADADRGDHIKVEAAAKRLQSMMAVLHGQMKQG
ncbi:MAG: hypothetical protein DCC75_07755 [Proteobacteria bacterium]|nr:MAG: hypothetical protein DCC75_07755 [Pseudomonadota bacterium]